MLTQSGCITGQPTYLHVPSLGTLNHPAKAEARGHQRIGPSQVCPNLMAGEAEVPLSTFPPTSSFPPGQAWANQDLNFLHSHLFLISSAPQKLSTLSKKWSSNHSREGVEVHFQCIPHMTGKELDHLTGLRLQRALGALKHLEEGSSWGWILDGSNGSDKEISRLSFQQTDYCLILQIEEMKHRETMGWPIVEMKDKPMHFDFQSTKDKSSLPHLQSHIINILRAGPAPLICFMSVATSPSSFADPFTLSNRAVRLNLLTAGLLSLAFLHILHVACGSPGA